MADLTLRVLDAEAALFAIERSATGATVRFLGGEPVDAAVRVGVGLPGASDPWWLIPDRELSGDLDRQAMHVGWISGVPWAFALLQHGLRVGRTDQVTAARRVIDFITANLSPSGTFWGVWYREHGWSQSWSTVPDALHSRTLAEATLFLLRAEGLRPDPAWAAAARSNLDAVVRRQRADGNLGWLHHAVTGQVLSWSGASGLTWVAALVCTRELVELSAALGDDHFRLRALETLTCFRQFIARQDGDFNALRGMVSERYYQTTCFQAKGMLLTLSHAWSVGVTLLACEQAIELGLA